MVDVTIIGGGLSGLAAAFAVQQAGVSYRLIEVKDRLGGSIATEREAGWVLDTGLFGFSPDDDWDFLADVGLNPAHDLIEIPLPTRRPAVAFRHGTGALIDAYAKRLTGTIIHRMAVSSIGKQGERFTLCLENGMVWDTGAVIVAAPARYAERMLRNLAPQAAAQLEDYPYDTITRLALGYAREYIPQPEKVVWDMGLPHYFATSHPDRVPTGHILLQLGVRHAPLELPPRKLVSVVQRDANLPPGQVIERVSRWAEAEPLRPHDADFYDWSDELEGKLPEGLALAGNDYAGLSLAERVESGYAAAERVL